MHIVLLYCMCCQTDYTTQGYTNKPYSIRMSLCHHQLDDLIIFPIPFPTKWDFHVESTSHWCITLQNSDQMGDWAWSSEWVLHPGNGCHLPLQQMHKVVHKDCSRWQPWVFMLLIARWVLLFSFAFFFLFFSFFCFFLIYHVSSHLLPVLHVKRELFEVCFQVGIMNSSC